MLSNFYMAWPKCCGPERRPLVVALEFWTTALLLWLFGAMPMAHAHKASDAYLSVTQTADSVAGPTASLTASTQADPANVNLQLSLAAKDLDAALDTLDANNDRQLTWGEVRLATPDILRRVGQDLQWRCADKPVPVTWVFEALEQRSDGVYVRVAAGLSCPAPLALSLNYELFKDVDSTHRLIVAGNLGGQPLAAVLAPDVRNNLVLRKAQGLQGGQEPQTGMATLAHFFPEGVHHILTGYDHLTFLLALLLPISLRWDKRVHAPTLAGSPSAHHGLQALVRTVTGFTIGHSVTLLLANTGWIHVSSAWVEPAIAATIAVTALLNLYPQRWLRGDVLALGFGLVHGLGFSGVMAEAGVTGSLLLWGLAGFNLGVEAGQLAVLLLWCALHLAVVRWAHYQAVVVRGGSWALMALALFWMAQRLQS